MILTIGGLLFIKDCRARTGAEHSKSLALLKLPMPGRALAPAGTTILGTSTLHIL